MYDERTAGVAMQRATDDGHHAHELLLAGFALAYTVVTREVVSRTRIRTSPNAKRQTRTCKMSGPSLTTTMG
jgi:hypothetical protein